MALVPPERVRAPSEVLDVLIETRMFSIDWAVRAQLLKASLKLVAIVLSKRPGGKLASLVQPAQAKTKPTLPSPGKPAAELKLSAGKLVRLEQACQAERKYTPEEVSIRGKLVRLEQPLQAKLKFVPEEVSISEKLVRLLQPCQV